MAAPPDEGAIDGEGTAEDRRARIAGGAMLLESKRMQRTLEGHVSLGVHDALARMGSRPSVSKAATYSAIAMASRVMVEGLRDGIAKHRAAARAIALERLHIELVAAGVTAADVASVGPSFSHEDDLVHATIAAESLASQWRAMGVYRVMAAERKEEDASEAVRSTREAMKARVERTSLTETAQAFNDERRRAARDFAEREPEVAKGLARRWESALEKNTCEDCASHDGEIVGLDEAFRGGDEPADMHPRCLCTESIVDRIALTPIERRASRSEEEPSGAATSANAAPAPPSAVPYEKLSERHLPSDPKAGGYGALTEDQFKERMRGIVATFDVAQREAVSEFTGNSFSVIRKVQRMTPDQAKEYDKIWGKGTYRDFKKVGDTLSSLHTPQRAMPGVVYRGIRCLPQDAFDQILKQNEVTFAGTSSTSRSADVVKERSIDRRSPSVFFILHQRTAVPVESIGMEEEREFLVRDGTKFKVLSRARMAGSESTLVLELEEL